MNDDGSDEDHDEREQRYGLTLDRRVCPLGYRLSDIVRFAIEDALGPGLSRGESKRTPDKDDGDENNAYD